MIISNQSTPKQQKNTQNTQTAQVPVTDRAHLLQCSLHGWLSYYEPSLEMLPCSLAVETLQARFLQLVSWALCKRMYCLLEDNWQHGAEVFGKSIKCRQLSKKQLGLKPVFQFLTRKAVTWHRLLVTVQKKWLWQPNLTSVHYCWFIENNFITYVYDYHWLTAGAGIMWSVVIRLQTGWPRNHAVIPGRGRRSCASPMHPVNTADSHL